jgi:3-deoxy-7-phosphoheptulonate synthase
MIIVLKSNATQKEIDHVIKKLTEIGLKTHISRGKERVIIGAIGDERLIGSLPLSVFPGVEQVLPILSPYKLVSREFKKEDSVIEWKADPCHGRALCG